MKKQEKKRGRGRPRKQQRLGGNTPLPENLGVSSGLQRSLDVAMTHIVIHENLNVVEGPIVRIKYSDSPSAKFNARVVVERR